METLTITRLPLNGFNDPNAIPCQQSYAQCDQIATVHIDAGDWDVDTCAQHAARVMSEWADRS